MRRIGGMGGNQCGFTWFSDLPTDDRIDLVCDIDFATNHCNDLGRSLHYWSVRIINVGSCGCQLVVEQPYVCVCV